jgi:hypothetical protein
VITTSSTTSTSATASPTLGNKQTVGPYTFQGCYTEATGQRALSAASFFDYTAMTLEECANDCNGYTYFGVEYGGECMFILPLQFFKKKNFPLILSNPHNSHDLPCRCLLLTFN